MPVHADAQKAGNTPVTPDNHLSDATLVKHAAHGSFSSPTIKRTISWLISISASMMLIFAGLAAFAHWGLPSIVAHYGPKWIHDNTQHHLSLENINILPLKLQVQTGPITLSTPSGEVLLKLQKLDADISWQALLTGRLRIQHIMVDGLQGLLAWQVVKKPLEDKAVEGDGPQHTLSINWMPFIVALQNALKTPEPEPDAPPKPFTLERLVLNGARLTLEDRRTAKPTQLLFNDINIGLFNISTYANTEGVVQLQAQTSFDAQLQLHAKTNPKAPTITGKLSFANLNIEKLQTKLMAVLPSFGLQNMDLPKAEGVAELQLQFDAGLADSLVNEPTAAGEPTFLPKLNISNAAFNIKELSVSPLLVSKNEHAELNTQNIHNLLGTLKVNALNVNAAAFDLQKGILLVPEVLINGIRLYAANEHAKISKPWAQVEGFHTQDIQLNLFNSASTAPFQFAIGAMAVNNLTADYADGQIAPNFAIAVHNTNITAKNITQDYSQAIPITLDAQLRTGGKIAAHGQIAPNPLSAKLSVQAEALVLNVLQPIIHHYTTLKLDNGTFDTQGRLALTPEGFLQYDGALNIENVRLSQLPKGELFLGLGKLSAPQINFSFNEKGTSIHTRKLLLQAPSSRLQIDSNRVTNLSGVMRMQQTNSNNNPPKSIRSTHLEAAPTMIQIDRLQVSNGQLEFSDQSLLIPFGTRIHSLSGVAQGLSTKPNTQAQMQLKGTVDRFGEARAQGVLDLFDPTRWLNIKVKFNNLEMASLSPYSATFANRKIESGKMNLALDYVIKNKQLQSENQITIEQLKLGERVQSPSAVDLPLDLALALLTDANGRIDLGLPITGSLEDPQFSYGALVWKVLGNVLNKIVTAPFRALAGLLGGGSDLDFEAMGFEPGQAELTPPEQEKLSQLVKVVLKRPGLVLHTETPWAHPDVLALQDSSMRRAVLMQMGQIPNPSEDPGPLNVDAPDVQNAMEAVYVKRFGRAQWQSLLTAHQEANRNNQGAKTTTPKASSKALGFVSQAFQHIVPGKPQGNAGMLNAKQLQGISFAKAMGTAIAQSTVIAPETLQKLSTARANGMRELLLRLGLLPSQFTVNDNSQIDSNQPNVHSESQEELIPLQLHLQHKGS